MTESSGTAERTAVLLAGCAILITALLPLLTLTAQWILSDSLSIAQLGELLGGRSLRLFGVSLALSTIVTALTLLIGIPLGILLGKADLRFKYVAWALHLLPVFLPPFLLVLGWFHLLGQSGFLGTEITSRFLFSFSGVVFVLVAAFTPIVSSLTAIGIQSVDPSLEEAARITAGPLRTIVRVILPIAWPAIALGAIIVFALSFSELGVPMFLRVPVYPAAVFSRLGGISYTPVEAFALVLPMLLIGAALLFIEHRFLRQRSFSALGTRSLELTLLNLGKWRWIGSGALWLFAIVSILPFVALILRVASAGKLQDVSLWLGSSLRNSLLTAGIAAIAILGVGIVIGWALARAKRGVKLFDALSVLSFVMPSAVLGIGLIAVWNHPTTEWMYASPLIIVIGFVARYSIVGIRTVAASIVQSAPTYEEAAMVAGSKFVTRMLKVVLPMHTRGILVAGLLAFLFCLRDLETSVIYYPAGWATLPVRIFTLEANGDEGVIAALAIIQVLLSCLVLALGGLFIFRRKSLS